MSDIQRIKELVSKLNVYRDAYYNQQSPIISDLEYDLLFDELNSLEESTGIILSNSPTVTVGYEVKSELKKIKHSHPMLSLDKTKSIDELKKFAGDKDCLISLKCDGLTVLLTYENGELIQAETRGNGEEGEIITHNAKVFENIPLRIDYKGHLEVEGEAIITYEDFENINAASKTEYKNPRNLASGSVRQLDSNIAAKRHIKFIAWKVPTAINNFENNDSFLHRLLYVKGIGFEAVPLLTYNKKADEEHINEMIEALKNCSYSMGYPIDGLVITYNNIPYGESLGMTGHHPKHSIAFKFYDEEVETTLKNIEWTMGKTGTLTPTAVFDPVEIDGTIVERASVHNISILEDLALMSNDIIEVYKANSIIPQVKRNISAEERDREGGVTVLNIPSICPVCGGKTEIKQDNNSQVLICTNENCKGKLLGKLAHFVSKNAMNIDGLSEATLEKFINLGWLSSFIDIYNLKNHQTEMMNIEGFGKKSVNKLMNAIEKSKNTTLDRFIYALCIPNIGRSASKTISKYCDGSYDKFYILFEEAFDWTELDDFGEIMASNLDNYIDEWWREVNTLANVMNFEIQEKQTITNNPFNNKTICVTGKLTHFTRDSINEKIASLGAKAASSVSKKTDYLLTNEASGSSKYKKAVELNITIITEEEFLKMIGE